MRRREAAATRARRRGLPRHPTVTARRGGRPEGPERSVVTVTVDSESFGETDTGTGSLSSVEARIRSSTRHDPYRDWQLARARDSEAASDNPLDGAAAAAAAAGRRPQGQRHEPTFPSPHLRIGPGPGAAAARARPGLKRATPSRWTHHGPGRRCRAVTDDLCNLSRLGKSFFLKDPPRLRDS
jgi:hypothetical protein